MVSIDHIFCISLDRFPEKWERVKQKMNSLGIEIEKISACDGLELDETKISKASTPSVEYTLKYGRSLHREMPSVGAIGCYLSHVKIWKKIIQKNLQNVLILEDDFHIPDIKAIKEYLKFLPKNYHTAFLGYFKQLTQIDHKESKINDYWTFNPSLLFGTYGYLISREGAERLLEKAFPIEMQVDSYISYMSLLDYISCYRSNKPLILTENISPSTIQNLSGIKCFINDLNLHTIICSVILLLFILIILSCLIATLLQRR